ncbi:uncharacterized protein LOC142228474 [Haematobia irritans]|uniref:uncharacterized protein LOC142228474 n=1 Tax=Haematobia irritans TaxID=7368 RepID=UPI003F4FC1EB
MSESYVKCGEVLISSSSLNNKDDCILRCTDCADCFSEISELILHYHRTHSSNDHDQDDEGKKSPQCLIEEIFEEVDMGEEQHEIEILDPQDDETLTIKYEYLSESEVVEEMDQSFFDIGEQIFDKSTESPKACDKAEVSSEDCDKVEESLLEYPESDEESIETADNKTSQFVRDFMNNELYVRTMITAYKMQPFLWNSNNSSQVRAKERPRCLQKIANEMESKLNVSMTSHLVGAVIARLRHDYREKQKRMAECRGDMRNKNQNSTSAIDNMDFLQPFMEHQSIYNLDPCLPPLTSDEIVQVIDIYKQIPVLWNTDLIENVCTNKRQEALEQMQNLLETEMGIQVSVNTLKKYTHCIHAFFTKEKRKSLTGMPTSLERSALYKYMQFLMDHVGPFKCYQCRRAFLNRLNLKVHCAEHDGSIPLKCSLCSKEYRTTDAYMAHARRHMDDLKFACKECGKKFSRPADLEIHRRCHTGAKPYCCEICGVSFRHSQAFTTHKRRHQKQYMHHCPICLKGFYKKDQMSNHLRTHNNIRDILCKICGKGFKTKKTMHQHLSTHEEGRKHLCTQCGKNFKNKTGLAQHLKIHRKCEIIDVEYLT